MGFLSFFKTPQPRKFEFTPRYYDPIKDEIEQRTAQIRQEMGLNNAVTDNTLRKERIKMSFRQRNTTIQPTNGSFSVGSLRLLIMGWLTAAFFGYLHYGSQALYILLLLGIAYTYWRFRRK
jgi:hypothetical protein